MIRNYPGFSQGISGARLAQETWRQAWTLGTTFRYMRQVQGLFDEDGRYRLRAFRTAAFSASARPWSSATSAAYRRVGIASLEGAAGPGVFYGSAVSEAPAMRGRNVFVAGGGNSAGQTALHMAKWAARVTVLVRGQSLAESMSDYLIREIDATPNVDICHRFQVAGGSGTSHLESLVLQDAVSGARRSVPADALFILIGSQPAGLESGSGAGRLPATSRGSSSPDRTCMSDASMADWHPRPSAAAARNRACPECSRPVDVRQGSIKRVASAVGEGAITIPLVHRYLETMTAAGDTAGRIAGH